MLQGIQKQTLDLAVRSTERMKSLDQRSDVYRLDRGRTFTVYSCTPVGGRGNSGIFYLAKAEVTAVLSPTVLGPTSLSFSALSSRDSTTERSANVDVVGEETV